MYCVTLSLYDIKKLTSVSLESTMEVHIADVSFLPFLVKALPLNLLLRNQISAENVGIKVSALKQPVNHNLLPQCYQFYNKFIK